jgi:ATP-dependent DNA ligase
MMTAIDFTYRPGVRPVELFQLFNHWDRKELPKGGLPVEEKIDGWRSGHWRGIDNQPRLWTKGGYEINGTGHIRHVIAEMERIAGQQLMLDGEFQVGGTLAATKAWCESGWKTGGEAGTLYLFDCMPEADWQRGRCDVPWTERKKRLKQLADEAMHTLSGEWQWREGSRGAPVEGAISVIEDVWLSDAAAVLNHAESVWERGGEGIVIKAPNAGYERKRSNVWMKVKKEGVR